MAIFQSHLAWRLAYSHVLQNYRHLNWSTSQVELGIIGAAALMGGAFQMRFYAMFRRRLRELRDADAAEEEAIEHAARKMAKVLQSELEKFEMRHSRTDTLATTGHPVASPTVSSPSTSRLLHEGKQDHLVTSRYRWSPFYSKASVAEHECQSVSSPSLEFTLPK
jgi:CRP-like cAMP-binding protein